MYDVPLTTWHQKYRYLRALPALLESGFADRHSHPQASFPYPAGHGTYMGAAVTVLQSLLS